MGARVAFHSVSLGIWYPSGWISFPALDCYGLTEDLTIAWRAFCCDAKSPLLPLETHVNAAEYGDILTMHLFHFQDSMCGITLPIKKMTLHIMPANSPDWNLIEHIWDEVRLADGRSDKLRKFWVICNMLSWINGLSSLQNARKAHWPACVGRLVAFIRNRGEGSQYYINHSWRIMHRQIHAKKSVSLVGIRKNTTRWK